MEPQTIRDEITQFVRSNFLFDAAATLRDDASLLETGVIDSTGVLELITHLEETYGVVFDDEDLVAANFDSIDKMTAFLTVRLA